MYLLELVVLAIGLAMDAFAVAVAAGASSKNNRPVLSLKLGTVLGLFQALMPVVGWLAEGQILTGNRRIELLRSLCAVLPNRLEDCNRWVEK